MSLIALDAFVFNIQDFVDAVLTWPDFVLQLITSDSVKARLDLLLYEPNNNWVLADLYLACNFPLTTTGKI